ncbi:MAG: ribosome maturation factor RimM [bacterium]
MEPTGRPGASADAPDQHDAQFVELGVIVNLHGIRGELRLLPHNPETTLIDAGGELVLVRRDGTRETHHVRGARRHKRFVLLVLADVDSANAAEALVGCRVEVPRSALPPAGPNAVYHADLIGCAVVTTDGTAVGRVQRMIVTSSNDICVVRGRGGEHLIPLIADIIADIDVAGRRMVVRPLPGLLDDDGSASPHDDGGSTDDRG